MLLLGKTTTPTPLPYPDKYKGNKNNNNPSGTLTKKREEKEQKEHTDRKIKDENWTKAIFSLNSERENAVMIHSVGKYTIVVWCALKLLITSG